MTDTPVEEDTAAEDSASSVDEADLSGYPWEFNPPVHPSLMHTSTGMPYRGTRMDLREPYAKAGLESASNYVADTDFTKLRLGRIAMGKQAWTYAAQELGTRFGFRFLYNPAGVTGGTYVNGNFIVNPSVTMASIIQDGLESISFELLLNRMPELQGDARVADYTPAPITEQALGKIRQYGTHWDLEYLYRCCNGLHATRSSSERTGDIGILLPNPCNLHLGPFISVGNVEMIQADDTMFTADMIPMVTRVSIVFRRILMMKGSSLTDIQKTTAGAAGDTATEPAGTDANKPPTSTGTILPGKEVYALCKWQGLSDADATLMTKVAYYESSWRPRAINSLPCLGLWQINMSPNLEKGRLKEYGLATKEDLFDPHNNAKAMRKLFEGQGVDNAWMETVGKARNSNITW